MRMAKSPFSESGRVRAVLGPTNTGKTHFALERMLGYATGMIGFPLRLLARENYDRIAARKGASAVALSACIRLAMQPVESRADVRPPLRRDVG